jgi:hypothetical protein
LQPRQLYVLSQVIGPLQDEGYRGTDQVRPPEPLPVDVHVPESVQKLATIVGEISTAGPQSTGRLVARIFPGGLREAPFNEADTMPAAEWVEQRLNDWTMDGVHQPSGWRMFKAIVVQARQDGLVIAWEDEGLTVYMLASDEI